GARPSGTSWVSSRVGQAMVKRISVTVTTTAVQARGPASLTLVQAPRNGAASRRRSGGRARLAARRRSRAEARRARSPGRGGPSPARRSRLGHHRLGHHLTTPTLARAGARGVIPRGWSGLAPG